EDVLELRGDPEPVGRVDGIPGQRQVIGAVELARAEHQDAGDDQGEELEEALHELPPRSSENVGVSSVVLRTAVCRAAPGVASRGRPVSALSSTLPACFPEPGIGGMWSSTGSSSCLKI